MGDRQVQFTFIVEMATSIFKEQSFLYLRRCENAGNGVRTSRAQKKKIYIYLCSSGVGSFDVYFIVGGAGAFPIYGNGTHFLVCLGIYLKRELMDEISIS